MTSASETEPTPSNGEELPEVAWQARIRALLSVDALWFGLVAVILGLRAQFILTPGGDVVLNPDETTALRWYVLAVAVLIFGWWGSDTTQSLVRLPRGAGRWVVWPSRLQWARLGISVLALAINFLGIRILQNNWYSWPGSLLWLASILVLLAVWIGEPSEPVEEGSHSIRGRAMHWTLPPRIEWAVFAAIMLLAIGLRLWRLGDLAPGMHGDEGEAGTDSFTILQGNFVSPWMRGWFNQPNVYYWTLAIFMKVFGTGLFGLRTFAALCGVITVLFTYLIAREMFGQRAAIIAGAFLSFQSADLLFSRQEFSNVTIPPLEAMAFYFVVRGLRTRKHLDFVVGGLAAGFGVYYFAGGRLIGPAVAAFLLYLAVVHPNFIRAYWSRALTFGLALVAMITPFAAYYLAFPIPTNSYPNDRFIWLHHEDLAAKYGSADWKIIVWNQLTRTLSVITHGIDVSAMSALDYPIARPLEAVLIVLGLAWSLWRWRDSRFALMSIWLWSSVIVGGVLTVDAPNLPRILGMLPVLALAIAAILDHLAEQVPRLTEKLGWPDWKTSGQWLGGGLIAVAVLVSGFGEINLYFVHYLNTHQNAVVSAQAMYVRDMGSRYHYFGMGAPAIYWTHGDNRFINPNADGEDAANLSNLLPVTDNGPDANKDVAFIVWQPMYDYLSALRAYYPEGRETQVKVGDPNQQIDPIISYTVSGAAINKHRVVEARYESAQGTVVKQSVPALGLAGGASPPPGLGYPIRATWDGGIVAPAYDTYDFRVVGSPHGRLTVDGVALRRSGSVVLAQGPHAVHLSATVASAGTRLEVEWSSSTFRLAPIDRRFLWDDHVGRAWLGYIQPVAGYPVRRIDGFLGWRSAQAAFGLLPGYSGTWKTILHVRKPGRYQFEINSEGDSSLSIDGSRLLDVHPSGTDPQADSAESDLDQGDHTLEVRYSWPVGVTGYLELKWTPPGGSKGVLISPDLHPPRPGAWRVGEVAVQPPLSIPPTVEQPGNTTPVPTPGPTLSRGLAITGSIPLPSTIVQPHGLAVDSGGTVYVGDAHARTVSEVDANGNVVWLWGGRGQGDGRFRSVDGVRAGPGPSVYVLDASARRIQWFDSRGKLEGAIPGAGTWCRPSGFSVAADRSVAVVDPCAHALDMYDASGGLSVVVHGGRNRVSALAAPADVAAGVGATVLVATRSGAVQLHGGVVSPLWSGSRGFRPSRLASVGNRAYLLDTSRGEVYELDSIGTHPRITARQSGVRGAQDIAVGPDGRVYVLVPRRHRVLLLGRPGAG